MAIKHNYLNTVGLKPTVAETEQGEIVPNFADGRLWTKNLSNVVIELQPQAEIDQNIDAGRADTIYGGTITIDCGGA